MGPLKGRETILINEQSAFLHKIAYGWSWVETGKDSDLSLIMIRPGRTSFGFRLDPTQYLYKKNNQMLFQARDNKNIVDPDSLNPASDPGFFSWIRNKNPKPLR
jgi:hypothetical protein